MKTINLIPHRTGIDLRGNIVNLGGDAVVNAHRDRVIADGGVLEDIASTFNLYKSLLGTIIISDCPYYAHYDRVIADGGTIEDDTATRLLITQICEL